MDRKEEKEIENNIREILKKILPEKNMISIKEKRKNELENKKNKTNKEEEEYEFLKEDLKGLVKHNYTKEYLVNLPNAENKILVFGLNPGGGQTIEEQEIIKPYEKVLCFDNTENSNPKVKELFNILVKRNCIFQNYFYKNFGLFENIDAKLFWNFYDEDNIRKILKKVLNNDREDLIDTFITEIYEQQQNDKPCIIFGDLFQYADGNQENIRQAINEYINKGITKDDRSKETKEKNKSIVEENEKKLYGDIKQVFTEYINYYNPKMIVVTNAYASDLIRNAFKEKEENKEVNDLKIIKNVPVIFSGMVSGGHALDKYSYLRLQRKIAEEWEKIK